MFLIYRLNSMPLRTITAKISLLMGGYPEPAFMKGMHNLCWKNNAVLNTGQFVADLSGEHNLK